MYMKNDCCCIDCTKRHIGCHGTCELYKAWSEKYKEEAKKARQVKKKYDSYFYHNGGSAW